MTAVLTPAAPIMTEMTIKNSTEDMIYDRSYRIRHNKNQVSRIFLLIEISVLTSMHF